MASKAINIIKCDGILEAQKNLFEKATTIVDLTGQKSLRFCSEKKSFSRLQGKLKSINTGISFLGTGDFHHLSLHFLSKLPCKPILILFDHHSDMMESLPGTVSCGSWAGQAVTEGKIKKCLVIGVNPEDDALIRMKSRGDILFFPKNIPHDHKISGLLSELSGTLGPIYISIDKDVLTAQDAATNWDQGSMTLKELMDFLIIVKKAAKIIGADICGEWPLPMHKLFYSRENTKKNELNERANLKILKTLLDTI